MDARHFDHLARSLSAASPRRRLLALLAALPLLGGLLALLGVEEAEARKNQRKNRRKTRKKPHKRAKRRRQKRQQRNKSKKPRCQAHSKAKTCANRCGTIRNNCKKTVDCGSCVCDPTCEICQTCNERTGVCEPDPAQQGDECGEPGQVCQPDGVCSCDASSCQSGQHCQGDVCVCDGSSCDGCCDAAGECQPGTANGACGTGGVACVPCAGDDTCGGGGQSGTCGCTTTTCAAAGKDCGTLDIGCGQTEECGTCPFPNQPCDHNVCGTCEPDCAGKVCGTDNDGCGGPCLDGSCPPNETCGGGDPGQDGVCGCTPTSTCPAEANCGVIDNGCGEISCGDPCGGTTPICVANVCTACSAAHPCPGGQCCNAGQCVAACPACQTCESGICAPCGADALCVDGACQACDVCQSGNCAFTSVQAAIDATSPQLSTIYVCPGTYVENANEYYAVLIERSLKLIGAGDGVDDAANTTLQPDHTAQRIVVINNLPGERPEVTLRGLRITGGSGGCGHGLTVDGSEVQVDTCTITDNRCEPGGTGGAGGGVFASGTDVAVTLSNTRITENFGPGGGGIYVGGCVGTCTLTLDAASRVMGNTSNGNGGIRAFAPWKVVLPSTENVTGNTPIPNCGGTGDFTGDGEICTEG